MRRKEREVSEFEEIYDILKRCHTLRIGFAGEEYPYVVPVSFGVCRDGERVTIYFHGAKAGYKVDLIHKNPRVCIEGDLFYKVEPTAHGITTRYESVLGFGTIEKAEGNEIIAGLKAITEHYGYVEYPLEKCKGLPMTVVYKIQIATLTGKRNVCQP